MARTIMKLVKLNQFYKQENLTLNRLQLIHHYDATAARPSFALVKTLSQVPK